MSILDDVAKEGYLATPAEVEQVVQYVGAGTAVKVSSEGAYFKVLLNHTLADGGDEKALNKHHKWMYEIVLKELTTKDMTAKERNSATNFARTAKATLRACIKEGVALSPGLTKGMASTLVKQSRENRKAATTKSPYNIACDYTVGLAGLWSSLDEAEKATIINYLSNSGVIK